MSALLRTNAGDMRDAAGGGDFESGSWMADQERGRALGDQRAPQGDFQKQPPCLDGDQVLISRAVRRSVGEAFELVTLTGSEGKHGAVHVGGLQQQDVADGPQEAVRLHRVRDPRAPPRHEVLLKVRTEEVRVLFKDRDVMSPPAQEQSRGEPSDAAPDDNDARHIASPPVLRFPPIFRRDLGRSVVACS